MKRALVVIVVGVCSVGMVVSIQHEAQACSCVVVPDTPERVVAGHELVFKGLLTDMAWGGQGTFAVRSVFKGDLRPHTAVTINGLRDICSLVKFKEGKWYTVFADLEREAEGGGFVAYGCTRHGEGFNSDPTSAVWFAQDKPDEDEITGVTAAVPAETSWPLFVGLGAGAGILIGGGAVLAVRRRGSTESP